MNCNEPPGSVAGCDALNHFFEVEPIVPCNTVSEKSLKTGYNCPPNYPSCSSIERTKRLTFRLGTCRDTAATDSPILAPSMKQVDCCGWHGMKPRYSAAFSVISLWSWLAMVHGCNGCMDVNGNFVFQSSYFRIRGESHACWLATTCPALPTLTSFEVATFLASSCGHVVKARSSVSWRQSTRRQVVAAEPKLPKTAKLTHMPYQFASADATHGVMVELASGLPRQTSPQNLAPHPKHE